MLAGWVFEVIRLAEIRPDGQGAAPPTLPFFPPPRHRRTASATGVQAACKPNALPARGGAVTQRGERAGDVDLPQCHDPSRTRKACRVESWCDGQRGQPGQRPESPAREENSPSRERL